MTAAIAILQLHPSDDVAVAVEPIAVGTVLIG